MRNYGGLEAISAIRNNEIDVKSEVAKNPKLIDIRGAVVELRKILSNWGVLEAILAIRNIEIDVKSKVANC